jgi:hypothetical protein
MSSIHVFSALARPSDLTSLVSSLSGDSTGTLDRDISAIKLPIQTQRAVSPPIRRSGTRERRLQAVEAALAADHSSAPWDIVLPSLDAAEMQIPTIPASSSRRLFQPPRHAHASLKPPRFGRLLETVHEQGVNEWNLPSAQSRTWQRRHASNASPSGSERSFAGSDSRRSSPGPLPRSPYTYHVSRRPSETTMPPSTRAILDGIFLDFLARLCSNREP